MLGNDVGANGTRASICGGGPAALMDPPFDFEPGAGGGAANPVFRDNNAVRRKAIFIIQVLVRKVPEVSLCFASLRASILCSSAHGTRRFIDYRGCARR